MKDVTLVTVSWNQVNCLKLLLKSYVKYHYKGEPLKLVIVDNFSEDGTREWLNDNEIPYVALDSNVGHENALNVVWNDLDSEFVLINDSDIVYHDSVELYIEMMNKTWSVSAGEIVENWFEQTKLVDRISPWFMFLHYRKLKEAGIQHFRDPSVTDWTFDVGSWLTQEMFSKGFKNFNIPRKPGNQDLDVVSMKYNYFTHTGKCSWNLYNHLDRFDEINKRRNYVFQKLFEFEEIDVMGKFVSGLK